VAAPENRRPATRPASETTSDRRPDDFRSEIERLAEDAKAEIRERAEKPQPGRRPWPKIVPIGITLIVAELASLAAMLYIQQRKVSSVMREPNPVFLKNDCRGAEYRTVHALFAFQRDNERYPDRLDELVGKYLDRQAINPETQKPLAYAREGDSFRLRCK
jgi:hypothetical protein